MRLWIKDPLAIFADDAERGVVVEGTQIVERVGRGETPERIGATFGQGFGGQRHLWRQRERIAQFGVDKFDCAHGWKPD